jgi:hypothetical protein
LQIPGSGIPSADLIMLPQQAGSPPVSSVTFYAVNSRTVARTLRHSDGAATVFADLEFPPGALASLDGVPLGTADSVRVTITPDAGIYGITLSPAGLVFATSARPTVTLSYARYGDLSAGLVSFRYPDALSYAAALDIWRDAGVDRWIVAAGSGGTGGDAVTARVSGGGRYVAAAPR